MNKKKQMVQAALALAVIVIGIYMLLQNTWGTPPALSGLGFLLAGFAIWVPHCPIMRMIFGE